MKHDRSSSAGARANVAFYALKAAGLMPDGVELTVNDHRQAGYPTDCQDLPLVVVSNSRESCIILTLNGQTERVPLDLDVFALWFIKRAPYVFREPMPVKAG